MFLIESMKSIILALTSTIALTTPALSSDSANIWLNNECHEGLYYHAEWYNSNIQEYESEFGYVPPNVEAIRTTFTIYGSGYFYIEGKSENWTWKMDYVDTSIHLNFGYTFSCE